MREVPQAWDAYPMHLQGDFVMVAVNLGLDDLTPIEELPSLHWVRVAFEPGDAHGFLPSAAGQERLEKIEDWLAEFADQEDGVLVARLTGPGRREFFLYMDTDRSESLLLGAQNAFGDDAFEIRARPDEDWQVYSDFLFPDPLQYQRILNQRVVRLLEENGDMLGFPRPVAHEAKFHTQEAAASFVLFLGALGLEGDEPEIIEDEDSEERSWHVKATKTHNVELATIERIVTPVFLKVRELGGTYDGWECRVVKAN